MANLDSNTQYGSPATQPSIANLSGLVKALQERTQQTSSNTVQTALTNHLNPTVAASIFSPSQPLNNSLNPAPVSAPTDWTPPVDTPFDPSTSGTPTEPLPEGYNQFAPTDANAHWVAPTDQAELRNWPTDLGGGQFIIDPSQPGKMIKSDRYLIPDDPSKPDTGIKKAILGKLSGSLYQVDHNIPLWAGGADTLANMQVLDLPTHERKTAAQAVPLTLLANGKIDLSQARQMALTWQNKDVSGLPTPDNSGYVPLATAEKYQQKWENDVKNPNTWKYFGEAFKENMGNFGKGWLPTPIREFAKGLVGGGTAGVVPGTGPSADSGTLGTIGNIAGNVVGTLTGLGLLTKGLGLGVRGARVAMGIKDAVTIGDEALATAGLTTDIGNVTSAASQARMLTLKKMASNAGLLSLWGQIGLTGKDVTGQDTANFKNHVTQFLSDVAFGSLLGSAKQSIKGYVTVGLGSTALSLMEGQEIVPALQNGALMSALHGMAYEKGMLDPKTKIGNDEAYKMSATTLNQYVGDVVPTVKKGQTIPSTLKLDIEKVDKMRTDYQQKYPNDQRFKGVGPITTQADAVQFIGQAAKRELGNSIAKSDGTIPQEQIKKEMTRITVAQNQLLNQTLDPVARSQKEWTDLTSMGEKLRPQLSSKQLRPNIDATKLLNDTPFEFPNQTFENSQGLKFLTGNVPTTGYGDNIDVNAKQTINDYYNNPRNYSGKLFVVKDPETAKVMRLIAQEQTANGKPVTVGNPDDALRVFVKVQTADGGEIRPVGYMPRQQSFDIKRNNLNQTYYEITNRLRHIVETSKTPDSLKAILSQDKAGISIDDATAQKLFDNRATLKSMPDEELYSLLKPSNAFEKYDSSLNNSAISQEMDKHGLNVLVVDKSKLLPIGGNMPRRNPTNPYISLNLNEQDWLRSIALKDGNIDTVAPNAQSTPIEQGIRSIISKIKAQKTSETAGNILDKVAPEPISQPVVEKAPVKPTGLTKNEIRSLKKQGFSDEMIQKINSQKIVEKPIIQTLPLEESPQTPPETAVLPPVVPQEAPKTPSAVKTPEPVQNAPKQAITTTAKPDLTEEFFNDMVTRIDDLKLDLSSPENHEKSLMSVINGFKRKNPGLPENEFRNVLNDAKSRAKAYVQDFIDNTYQGTKRFGTDDLYSRAQASENKNVLIKRYNELKARGKEVALKPFEKTEMSDLETKIKKHVELDKKSSDIQTKADDLKRPLTDDEKAKLQDLSKQRFTLTQDYQGGKNSSLVLANKFGLELQPPNDAGIRYLKLDRGGNPTFTEEFKKSNGIKDQSPMDFWGSFLGNEMKVYKSTLSKGSKEWGTGIEEMKKSGSAYAKGFASAIDEALKEKYDVKDPKTGETKYSWKDSWKANSALKNMKNWFDLSNEEGYANSQPFRRTAAITAGKNYAEVRKNVTRADTETKKINDQTRENRIDLISKGNSPVLPEGMSVKDPNQFENVSEDLTPFDMMTNGLLNAEVRTQLVDRYNNLRKEMGAGLAKSNPKVSEEMKTLFAQIKKLSVNIPDEAKTWKEGSKIVLKNGGKPTTEEGIKDGIRIAASIFKNKKTPGYIRYENIRNTVLKQLGSKEGKGGPYDGQGGLGDFISGTLGNIGNGIKDMFTRKINYSADSPGATTPSATSTSSYPTNFTPPKTPQVKTTPEQNYDVRGVKVPDSDLNETANILYGEISNRDPDKQQFEVRHIVNTAINRANDNPNYYGGSLTKVLQKPYQYQSYAPQGITTATGTVESQYQKASAGSLDPVGNKKLQLIKDTLNELKTGKFKDTTGGSMFYVHASDGSLWLGSTSKQAKDRANQYEKKMNIKNTRWGTAIGLPSTTSLTQR